MKRWVFDNIVGGFFSAIGKINNGKFLPHILQLISPVFKITRGNKNFLFYTPNALTRSRGETLFTKEAETIEWIDGFENGTIFYDIGANVGVYTIYAGVSKTDLKIFAFEPTYFNYSLLNKNIFINKLDATVSALCVALSDRNALDYIYMPEVIDGAAMVNFGSNLDYNKEKFDPTFKQGSLAFSLDYLVTEFNMPIPNYIKIDVDGLEKEIIHGALQTLKNPAVKSILIELNENIKDDMELLNTIKECGFSTVSKKQGDGMSKISKFSHMHNYIFSK